MKFVVVIGLLAIVAVCNADVLCEEENEEYRECGTLCPISCQRPQYVACANVCREGCYCKSGYIRDVDSNRCVRPSQCPPYYGRR